MKKVAPKYLGPAGGWGSLRGMAKIFAAEIDTPNALLALACQNEPHGFACVSCAWAKPADPHFFEFCENGAKATFWELTSRRCDPTFFAAHRVSALQDWSDFDLEQQGRLTHRFVILQRLTDMNRLAGVTPSPTSEQSSKPSIPSRQYFICRDAPASRRHLYSLFARLYGHNNLPDSSNMCHETTSVALKKAIGSAVGTVTYRDLAKADALFFFGQNIGPEQSPRFLHPLQDAVRRGVKIVTFNPLRERGLERFLNPQSPFEMVTGIETPIRCLKPAGSGRPCLYQRRVSHRGL